MKEMFELEHTYDTIKKDKRETHNKHKCGCSKTCAHVLVTVFILVLLLPTMTLSFISYIKASMKSEKGDDGLIGLSGSKENIGLPGPKGAKGSIGERGPKEDDGLIGLIGGKGNNDLPGPKGAKGSIGERGPKGDDGLIGLIGGKGNNGLPGAKGTKGSNGERGPKGDAGPLGPIGIKGNIGPQGPEGPEGRRGPKGDQGDICETGRKGQNGSTEIDFMEHVRKTQTMFQFLLQNVNQQWRCRNSKCFYFGFDQLNWHDARKRCKQIGDDLVKIDNKEENLFLIQQKNRVCYTSSTAYQGTVSTTYDGIPCQRWDSQTPHKHKFSNINQFPDKSMSDVADYCRDPENDEEKIWCYTVVPDERWEFCYVPKCPDDDEEYWIGLNDIDYEGSWKWTASRQSVTSENYTNWVPGEPNNKDVVCSEKEDCAGIKQGTGKWNDICCIRKQSFICMKRLSL